MDEQDKEMLKSIEQKLDTHNSKVKEEVRREMEIILKDTRSWYVDLSEKNRLTNERLAALEKRAEPALAVFSDAAGARRVIVWTLGGLAAIGGVILMFKQIFSHQ